MTWIDDKKERNKKWERESRKRDMARNTKLKRIGNIFQSKILPYKNQIEKAVFQANKELKKEGVEAKLLYEAGDREIVIKPCKERVGSSSKNVQFEKGHFVLYVNDEYKPVFALRDSGCGNGLHKSENCFEIKNYHVSKLTSNTVIKMIGVIFEEISINAHSYRKDDEKLFRKTFHEVVPISKRWFIIAGVILLIIMKQMI